MQACSSLRSGVAVLLIACSLMSGGCYSYRLATHAQPSTDALKTSRMHAHSLFWGLVNKPQVVHPKNCDDIGVNGMAEVVVKTNLGYALITIATLGIYCPVNIYWKCSKPCMQTDSL